MTYRRTPPDEPEKLPIDEVTWASFYARFKVVEQLTEDVPPTPPIVRQVTKNAKAIGRLDVRVNVILSGLAAGVLAYAGIITKGVVG